jgi:hypothetical protein
MNEVGHGGIEGRSVFSGRRLNQKLKPRQLSSFQLCD